MDKICYILFGFALAFYWTGYIIKHRNTSDVDGKEIWNSPIFEFLYYKIIIPGVYVCIILEVLFYGIGIILSM